MQRTYTQDEFHTFLMAYVLKNINNQTINTESAWDKFVYKLRRMAINSFLIRELPRSPEFLDGSLYLDALKTKDKITLIT